MDYNPYWALSKLWYLVDHGYVKEAPKENDNHHDDHDVVIWKFADWEATIQEPTVEQLRTHMIEEHIPLYYRPIIQAGALIGRSFSFFAAYAAVYPPEASDKDSGPSARAIERWNRAAEEKWEVLRTIDPDKMVLRCSVSQTGEKLVFFAQADLVGHIRTSIPQSKARMYHERLARYLVKPYEASVSDEFDEQFRRVDQAAQHWAEAGHRRDAADAHHRAADIAERGLAYQDAQSHYTRAIRFYTQLLADGDDRSQDHEDLLILAHCLYRVGQIIRLNSERFQTPGYDGDDQAIRKQQVSREDTTDDPKKHLEHALGYLGDLRTILLNNDDNQRWPQGILGFIARDIPAPDVVRHHLRLYEALSGYVNLELAACHEDDGDEHATRDRLFEALRNAEAARGEAGSRWLLASASAKLATQLVGEAIKLQTCQPDRSHHLAVEAFFHIERVLGLKPLTSEEERDFADPRSEAWRLIGLLFWLLNPEPRIAEWTFRKMNDHGRNVTAKVDKVTDRWLGFFLLSLCEPGKVSETSKDVRQLLQGYRDWAIESGLAQTLTPVYLRLFLLELVEYEGCVTEQTNVYERTAEYLRLAKKHAKTSRDQDACNGFQALYHHLPGAPNPDMESNHRATQWFKLRLDQLTDAQLRMESVKTGWLNLTIRVLRYCPRLIDFMQKKTASVLKEEWDRSDSELGKWVKRARYYHEKVEESPQAITPCLDRSIERLARRRLPKKTFKHSKSTRDIALELLKTHQDECTKEEKVEIYVLEQDVAYAAWIHDWYEHIDPARLLTLADEWNLSVTGIEWVRPALLHGKLAASVLKDIYMAEHELGAERYRRIERMVANHILGSGKATALEKIFLLANTISNHDTTAENHHSPNEETITELRAIAWQPGKLDEAYDIAKSQRANEAKDQGHEVL